MITPQIIICSDWPYQEVFLSFKKVSYVFTLFVIIFITTEVHALTTSLNISYLEKEKYQLREQRNAKFFVMQGVRAPQGLHSYILFFFRITFSSTKHANVSLFAQHVKIRWELSRRETDRLTIVLAITLLYSRISSDVIRIRQ